MITKAADDTSVAMIIIMDSFSGSYLLTSFSVVSIARMLLGEVGAPRSGSAAARFARERKSDATLCSIYHLDPTAISIEDQK